MVITKEKAKRFLEDCECGDILAILNLKSTTSNIHLYMYLEVLEKLNAIIIDMEDDTIPWDTEFNDLYRKAMELMCNKCKQIIKEE
jgi:DNA invertase Pin-like site-specific DNA recombinase